MPYTDYDPGNRSQTRGRDNEALEELAAADGALMRALQAIPNSVHTGFELPADVRELTQMQAMVKLIMAGVEENHRKQDHDLEASHPKGEGE